MNIASAEPLIPVVILGGADRRLVNIAEVEQAKITPAAVRGGGAVGPDVTQV